MKRLLILFVTLAACGEPGGDATDQEVITTVVLTLAPTSGPPVTATFDDPDGDGGEPPTASPLLLQAAVTYTMTVAFENRLESPPEIITQEVADEAEDHQVFFTGSAVGTALAVSYADSDANGLPIGLTSTVVASRGSGDLVVTLLHIPPVNDVAVKTAQAAEDFAAGGVAAVGGSADANVTFLVTVP